MKWFLVLMMTAGCSTMIAKRQANCIFVTAISCPVAGQPVGSCRLDFNDGSDFYLPKSMADQINVGDEVCEHGK